MASFWLHSLKACQRTCLLSTELLHFVQNKTNKQTKKPFIADPQANMTDACKIIPTISSWLLDIVHCFVAVLGSSSVVMQISFCSSPLEAGGLFTQRPLSSISASTQRGTLRNSKQKEMSTQGLLTE